MVSNLTEGKTIHTLDLNFRGMPGSIAAYLIPHSNGTVLVETGPASTLPTLEEKLREHGFKLGDVTDVLLTHIHLDHAGACGWLARQGARIHVHPVGAPHLVDPERLLSSAARIYGDLMQPLWGEFLAVPEEKIHVLEDNEELEVNGLRFRALDTPGHAYHHNVYIFEDVCFTGDIGGVRVHGARHLRLPMPPPEFHLELWRDSVRKLQRAYERGAFARIAPTHFGISEDVAWHMSALKRTLDEIEYWILRTMPSNPSIEQLTEEFVKWSRERSLRMGVNPELLSTYESANPLQMSVQGIYRYWHKVRNPS